MSAENELPSVTIDGDPWHFFAECDYGRGHTDAEERTEMRESHLIALLAALPVEQRGRLLLPYVDELKPLASALAERLASFAAEKLAAQRDALQRQLEQERAGRERAGAELAALRDSVRACAKQTAHGVLVYTSSTRELWESLTAERGTDDRR